MKSGRTQWQKEEETRNKSVLYWFFRRNSLPPSSSRSFRTQSHWSFITRQCHYSGRFLRVHLSHRMCNQFTLHHQFRIDTGRSKFEQWTDSNSFCLWILWTKNTRILRRSTWKHRVLHSTCIAYSMDETSKHGVLGRYQSCSEERIKVLSDTIERHHPSRHTPNLLYPESYSHGHWRNHIR